MSVAGSSLTNVAELYDQYICHTHGSPAIVSRARNKLTQVYILRGGLSTRNDARRRHGSARGFASGWLAE